MDKPKFNIGDHCIIFKTFPIRLDDGEVIEYFDDIINNEVVIREGPFVEKYYDTSKFYEVNNITKGFMEYVPEEILKLKENHV